MKYLNSQERLLPFRGQFQHNNLPYELAGHVVEKLSGVTYSEFVASRLTRPIGMSRTSFKTPQADTDNVVKCYNVLDDGTQQPYLVSRLVMMDLVLRVVEFVLASKTSSNSTVSS